MTTANRRRPRAQPRRSSTGKEIPNKVEPTADQFTDAQAIETEIAARAEEIRGDAIELTPALFMRLWPLLRRPIPDGFLVETSRGEGKPYDSIGVRSVQVQHDRMDNVLTPMWWYPETVYESGGKICHVTIVVAVTGDRPIVRDAWGGINRGSTDGNLYKGSYTNAAKLAFARIGPGHEVYLGATDFDPDVNPEAADQQVERSAGAPVAPAAAPSLAGWKAEVMACARDLLKHGIWDQKRLKAELVAAHATDTSTVGKAVASMPDDDAESLASRMFNLLAAAEETAS